MYRKICTLILLIFVCIFGIACFNKDIIFEKFVKETKSVSTDMIIVTLVEKKNKPTITDKNVLEKTQINKNCGSVAIGYDSKSDKFQIEACNLVLEKIENKHCNLLDDLKMITYEQDIVGAIATYNPVTRSIRVDVDSCNEGVFYHELGHHVWYTKLSKREKQEWCELWNEISSFITDYASTSCKEDFAENFTYFIIGSSDVSIDREKLLSIYVKRR